MELPGSRVTQPGNIRRENPPVPARKHSAATGQASDTTCHGHKYAPDIWLYGRHLLVVIHPGGYRSGESATATAQHYSLDTACHPESRTHPAIWCPCLTVVPVAQHLDEKRPIAIRFGIPARNRLWHTGRMAPAVCPWPLRIIDRYSIE